MQRDEQEKTAQKIIARCTLYSQDFHSTIKRKISGKIIG